MSKHTAGPWHVWPGPAYVGGGEDLCIGAGKTWLANMDHRRCVGRDGHFRELADCKLEPDSDICSFTNEITEEQAANARLIVKSPDMFDALADFVEWCRTGALTGSDRNMFVSRFSRLIAEIEGRS